MKRSFVPVIIASASAFVLGLVLGAGNSADDTSLSNTASKMRRSPLCRPRWATSMQ